MPYPSSFQTDSPHQSEVPRLKMNGGIQTTIKLYTVLFKSTKKMYR